MRVSSTSHGGAVVALVGRRIDPDPTLTPRFPFNQVDRVPIDITDQLRRSHAVALVSSAACWSRSGCSPDRTRDAGCARAYGKLSGFAVGQAIPVRTAHRLVRPVIHLLTCAGQIVI